MSQGKRERLRDIIARESLLTGDNFTLASGKSSGYFFDMKKTMFHPEGASLTADLIFEAIKDDKDVAYIGGLEMGAVPVIAGVCLRSWPERPISIVFPWPGSRQSRTTLAFQPTGGVPRRSSRHYPVIDRCHHSGRFCGGRGRRLIGSSKVAMEKSTR